jgi:ABC-type Zn uptake system ZnuABC Zn-binding protein ZnuA
MAATEELLGLLHDAVAQDLLEKIKAGTATPAEISTAVKFLKDNGIEAVPTENSKLRNLADSLPDFGDEEPFHAH